MPSGKSVKKANSKNRPSIEASSGNVFADLGIPNPDLAPAKAELVQRIRSIIAQRKLTQSGAAAILGLDQPKVSSLVRGRVEGYSLDRLFRFPNPLGQRIEINVTSSRGSKSAASRAITVSAQLRVNVADTHRLAGTLRHYRRTIGAVILPRAD